MAFCGKCGSPIAEGTSFCSRCGAPASPQTPGGAGTATQMTPNLAAALSYVLGFVSGIIFLVLEPYKNDGYVRFHAYQSIFFSLALLAFGIVWNIVLGILMIGFLWTLASLVLSLVYLAVFFYWLFLMYKAYGNERYMIPYIGELAAKQAGSRS